MNLKIYCLSGTKWPWRATAMDSNILGGGDEIAIFKNEEDAMLFVAAKKDARLGRYVDMPPSDAITVRMERTSGLPGPSGDLQAYVDRLMASIEHDKRASGDLPKPDRVIEK